MLNQNSTVELRKKNKTCASKEAKASAHGSAQGVHLASVFILKVS